MTSPLPLSVAIIASSDDMENYLPGCLASLPQGCEIIVVETVPNSGALSGQIIKISDTRGYTHYRYLTDSFSFADSRNIAKSLCTRTWILSIDCDERLMPHQFEELELMVRKARANIGGFFVTVTGLEPPPTPEALRVRNQTPFVRLFRNISEARWFGAVHEHISVSIQNAGLQLSDSNIYIHHTGYTTPAVMKQKGMRNFRLLMQQVFDTPGNEFYRNYLASVLTNPTIFTPDDEKPLSISPPL